MRMRYVRRLRSAGDPHRRRPGVAPSVDLDVCRAQAFPSPWNQPISRSPNGTTPTAGSADLRRSR